MLKNKNILLPTLIIAVAAFSGCDMINSIKDYFSKKNAPSAVSESVTESSEAVSAKSDASGPLPENVLARIGNWNITIDQFNDRLKAIKEVVPDFNVDEPKSKELVLEELTRQQLLVAEAEGQGLDKKQEIQDAIEEFRRTVLVREIASKLTENIEVSEGEAQAFYEQNKASLVEPPQIRVREIKTDTEEKAKAILVELLQGADFTATAKAKSIAASASNGGDLGILKELPFPEMLGPLQTLNEGQTSSVIKGPDGFYIIKIEEKKEGKQVPYEQVKKEILENRKLFKQQQAILEHIGDLEKKFKVETNKELLNKGK